MNMPFPGMDPYLEHSALWPGVHARLIVALADQLSPHLQPRFVASVEDRVFLEAEELEVHEHYLEILDLYRDQSVVTVIELVSPTNKAAGPGRESYQKKQQATLQSECHLVEIDLLRRGQHLLSIPENLAHARLQSYDYLTCISRWPRRKRFELYPTGLRDPLLPIQIPLVEPDADVTLDLRAALEYVYQQGGYALRVRDEEPCHPALSAADQQWANERRTAFRAARTDLFPPTQP
jgi:hypothetical protein